MHEFIGGARGSGIVSSIANVLRMNVVGEMRGVGMCVKCVCVCSGQCRR